MAAQFTEINNNDSLRQFCERISTSPLLAVDTEFVRERFYYAKLCLLQVGTDEEIGLVDTLSVTDLEPLLALFTDRKIVKIFHSCYQDMEILLQQFQCLPAPVHDTQIAATFLGYPNQVGYAAMIQKELGEKIDKSHTRTDWSRRPLTEAQKKYAANDVIFLPEIYRRQLDRLEQAGRLQWLEAELDLLSRPETYQVEEQRLWRKVKNSQSLKGAQLAVLSDLAIWRENTARRKNLPRKFVLKDDIMVDLARLRPESASDLTALRHFPKSMRTEQTKALFDLICNARNKPRSEWPTVPDYKKFSKSEEVLADSLMLIVKLCAQQHALSTEMLATRKEIDALVKGESELALLKGWRYQLAGRILEEFIAGKLQLRTESGKLEIAQV